MATVSIDKPTAALVWQKPSRGPKCKRRFNGRLRLLAVRIWYERESRYRVVEFITCGRGPRKSLGFHAERMVYDREFEILQRETILSNGGQILFRTLSAAKTCCEADLAWLESQS